LNFDRIEEAKKEYDEMVKIKNELVERWAQVDENV
jgi:uncharacterized lipoprotein YmbA